jgi:hypothetical protein
MKKNQFQKLTFIFTLSLILISCKTFLGITTKTVKPETDIKTNYNQFDQNKDISINKFEYKILDSTLNLFKSEVLIVVKIEGEFKIKEKQNFIQKVMVLSKVNGLNQTIELIPSLQKRKNRKDHCEYSTEDKDNKKFKMNLQIKITNLHFGKNIIILNCYDQKQEFNLTRTK